MKFIAKIFAVILFLTISNRLQAQNFSDALRLSQPGLFSGVRALGMGNSFTALSDDYSGMYFNPAGLGTVNEYQISGSFNFNSFNNSTTFFNVLTDAKQNNTAFQHVGLVFPIPTKRGSLVFGFGYNRMKDYNRAVKFDGYNASNNSFAQILTDSDGDNYAYELGLAYYDSVNAFYDTFLNGKLQQIGKILEDGSLNKWTFSGAIEVAKDVFVGASINVITGDYRHDRDYAEVDSKDNYPASARLDPNDPRTAGFLRYDYHDVFDWTISGWDMNLGFLYKLRDFARIGANIKFPSKIKIQESYVIDATSDFLTDGFFLDPPVVSNAEYDISTPFEFSGAAAVSLHGLTLSGQAKLIDYTEMEFTGGLDRSVMSLNNNDIKDLFRAVVNYNLGVEYTLPVVEIKLRAGFIYQPSPYEGDPSKYDRKYITGGLGIVAGEAFVIDLAYAKGWWNDFGDNYGSNLSRTYQEINKNIFKVGFTYRY